MDVVTALHASAAVLLIVAGTAKIARPAPTADLLAALGLAARPAAAVAIGVVEAGVGATALALGGAVPAVAPGVL